MAESALQELETLGGSLRSKLVALLKDHLTPQEMADGEVGALGITSLLRIAQARDGSLFEQAGKLVFRFWGVVGQEEAVTKRIAEHFGVSTEDLLARLDADKGFAEEVSRFIRDEDLAPQFEESYDVALRRRRGIDAASDLTEHMAPWELVDDGVREGRPSLGDFNADQESLVAAVNAARDWAGGVGKPILYLVGDVGTGKTHILEAVAALLKVRERLVIYRTDGDLFGELRAAMSQGKFEEAYEAFAGVPNLIWDDLGRDTSTEFRKETLDRLVDDRYRRGLFTLIGTNVSPLALTKAGMGRAASRLSDGKVVTAIAIQAGDYRLRR